MTIETVTQTPARGGGGVVAAGHPITAAAARDVLEAGGNAYDAAIAALWAACAAEPVLASPGGGGFLLAQDAHGPGRLWDFFVHTPRARREGADFYQIEVDFGVATQAFHVGFGAMAVPGFVRGLFEVHRALGTMPMRRLVEPAVEAARHGVVLSEYQAYLLEVVGPIYDLSQPVREIFRCDDPRDADDRACRSVLKSAGASICNAPLAGALEALALEGDRLFYEGEIAAAIVEMSRDGGGHLTSEDLRSYAAIERAPLERRHGDATLFLNPPPSAGGLLIALSLELVGRAMPRGSVQGSPEQVDVLVEAMAATNRARAECATSDGVPSQELLDEVLIERLAGEVVAAPASSRGTTHVSVIDGEGRAASATVSNGEGCGHLVPGAGFMMNNMLGEEDLCHGGVGHWASDRRMSSMMAPGAVRWDDGRLAVLGSGGSNRIRTAILQVLHNLIDHRMPASAAVEAPRVHVEGDHVDAEATLPEETLAHLRETRPDLTIWPEPNMFFGGVHTAVREADGVVHGAGDPRRAGLSLTARRGG